MNDTILLMNCADPLRSTGIDDNCQVSFPQQEKTKKETENKYYLHLKKTV